MRRTSSLDTLGKGRRRTRPTLELMEPRQLLAVLVVNTASDETNPADGTLSLREAILAVDAGGGGDTITFAIPPGGAQTIRPTTPLPPITKSVTIDGTTQPGFNAAKGPLIELNGTSAGSGDGLTLLASNSTIRGLKIDNFQGYGILVEGSNNTIGGASPDHSDRNVIYANANSGILIFNATFATNAAGASGNVVQGNYIGVDATGIESHAGNKDHGVAVVFASNETIGGTTPGARNVIGDNLKDGVLLVSSPGVLVEGNFIGVDSTGLAKVPNGNNGVDIQDSPNDTIGGTTPGSGNVISGNLVSGVQVLNDGLRPLGTAGTLIAGNFIGTDATGKAGLFNNLDGVFLEEPFMGNGVAPPLGVTVGGTTPAARNVISGNYRDGIRIDQSASGNLVEGNYIGTDVTGNAILSNVGNGVEIQISSGNTIGGSTPGTGNVISGNNLNGVAILGAVTANDIKVGNASFAQHNVVQGNFIGLGADGRSFLDNHASGVNVDLGAANNTIGGLTSNPGQGTGNVISGNFANGVQIQSDADSNIVQGNIIGLDADGKTSNGNQGSGVIITESFSNTIGGADPMARNVISANFSDGVTFREAFGVDPTTKNSTPANNIVAANYIGTDTTGLVGVPNDGNGVSLIASDGNTIGGTTAASRNVISGNAQFGVAISGNFSIGDQVIGNYIGPDALGNRLIGKSSANSSDGNGAGGVSVSGAASKNFIGGPDASFRNVISGNGANGVEIRGTVSSTSATSTVSASVNLVRNNYIGLDPSGTKALGNLRDGVFLSNTSGNAIGFDSGNVISGNFANGIEVFGDQSKVDFIFGNFVGTDALGVKAVPNQQDGVLIDGASSVVLGGIIKLTTLTTAGRNVISGNGRAGIEVTPNATGKLKTIANNITIRDAFLGTDAAGTKALPNGGDGIVVNGTNDVTIGGSAPDDGNLISGNAEGGVQIEGVNAGGSVLLGNFIGTDVTHKKAVGNGIGPGVFLNNVGQFLNADGTSTPGITIGGTGAGDGNVISGNVGGIQISGLNATGNQVFGNKIGVDDLGTKVVPIPGTTTGTPSQSFGILLSNAPGNTIGGPAPGQGNVIALGIGGGSGIAIGGGGSIDATTGKPRADGSAFNVIQGNHIGTDAAGKLPLGNDAGIYLNTVAGNTIGGANPGDGNIISTSQTAGIYIFGNPVATTQNVVQGNRIGASSGTPAPSPSQTDVKGTFSNGIGVYIEGASGNTIGASSTTSGGTRRGRGRALSGSGTGPVTMTGNVIDANLQAGVYEFDQAINTLQDNEINNNGNYGVLFYNSALNADPRRINQIRGNVIADFREFTGPAQFAGRATGGSTGTGTGRHVRTGTGTGTGTTGHRRLSARAVPAGPLGHGR